MKNINPKKIVKKGIVTLSHHSSVQLVGIDLSLQESFEIDNLAHHVFIVNEIIDIPSNMFALVWSRSTFNRKGLLITGSVFEPGYSGAPKFTMYNLSGRKQYFKTGERLIQILFFKISKRKKYNGQYQYENL